MADDSTADLLERVRSRLEETVESEQGRPPGRTLCLAWSGGLDSTVLLDVLRRLRARVGFELAAVHVDHGLHDKSTSHADFCRRLASSHAIPLSVEAIDLDPSDSVEATARHRRYAAVAGAARRFGASYILTGHHADDAVETALLNWIRGTGGTGLGSLAGGPGRGPESLPPDLELLRPLRSAPRRRLEQYADTHDLDWREDPTNRSRAATRNRIRRDIVPALLREAGDLAPLVRTLENLADEGRAIDRRARRLVADPGPGDSRSGRRLPTDELAEAPRAEAAAALRRAARRLPRRIGWSRETLTRTLDAADRMQNDSTTFEQLAVRGGRVAITPRWTLLEATRERGGAELGDRTARPLEIDLESRAGSRTWFGWRLHWRYLSRDPPRSVPRSSDVAWFDADGSPDTLRLRGPRSGEEVSTLGGPSTTELGEVLRAGGVPRPVRWRWPVLVDSSGGDGARVWWVAGLRRGSPAPVRGSTTRILEFELRRRPGGARFDTPPADPRPQSSRDSP